MKLQCIQKVFRPPHFCYVVAWYYNLLNEFVFSFIYYVVYLNDTVKTIWEIVTKKNWYMTFT